MKAKSSSLLISESPLVVQPRLAAIIGINPAIILQQIQYWLRIAEQEPGRDKFRDGKWWTYNTYKQWQEQFPWLSESGVRKTIKVLRDLELIEVAKHNSQGQDHKLWYTINYDKLTELEQQHETPANGDVSQSNTSEGLSEGSMCPDVTVDVSQSDVSYATETSSENTNEDSSKDSSSESGESNESPPPRSKDMSSPGQYGVAELVRRRSRAKTQGRKPAVLDEGYKKRFGEIYAAHFKEGYEAVQLEPMLDYIVDCACGDGDGWRKGKRQWIPFISALDHVNKHQPRSDTQRSAQESKDWLFRENDAGEDWMDEDWPDNAKAWAYLNAEHPKNYEAAMRSETA